MRASGRRGLKDTRKFNMDEKARHSVIVYDGKEYWPEPLHLARLQNERPEALNWCNQLDGEMGSIKLYSAGEYGYWKNGSTKREDELKEALNIISEDLWLVISHPTKGFRTLMPDTLSYLKKIQKPR